MECDAASLLLAAKCFGEIPPGVRPGVRDYLLCQWANKQACSDPDARAFINFIGLKDAAKQAAVCQLCLDLKNTVPATTPGTSFWDRDVLIYPMVADGPSYPLAQQGVNLKAPGTFTLIEPGGAPIYSDRGIQGVKRVPAINSGFLDTQYIIPAGSQNNLRVMWYMDVDSNAVNDFFFGTQNAAATSRAAGICVFGLGWPFSGNMNDFSTTAVAAGASPMGAYFIERNPGFVGQIWLAYGPGVVWNSKVGGKATAAPSPVSLFLFACQVEGTAVPSSPGQCRLSGFSLGSYLSDAERLQYKNIWDTFENALGRGHP